MSIRNQTSDIDRLCGPYDGFDTTKYDSHVISA